MKSGFVLFASLLVTAASVTAFPFGIGGMKLFSLFPRLDMEGALYFMTNEPDENIVMAASIGPKGDLRLEKAIAAGGRGAHGDGGSPPGPDGLFSQGGIVTSANGQVLAIVNAGSNTVSLFSINPRTPTDLDPLGDPVSSEGEFPSSLVFNKAGTRLCVLNGGAVAGVNCFTVDKKLGLVAIPNSLRTLPLQQTTPPNGPPGTASQITFNEDESKLIVSVKGAPPVSTFFAVWDVKQDGSLSDDIQKIAPPSGRVDSLLFSLTPIPGKNAFVVTDPAIGFSVLDLSGQNKSSAITIPGQGAVCWSSFSPKTGNFFLSDVNTAIITEVHVDDDLKATIVKQYPQAANSGTIDNDVATVRGKDFLFVLAATASAVDVLELGQPGNAKKVASMDIRTPARLAGVTVTPSNLQGMAHFIRQ